MKQYFTKKSLNFDEYNSYRKIFAYQYGTASALYYILGLQMGVQNLIFDMRTGFICINSLKVNFDQPKVSPYSLRLSRNVLTFLDMTLLNGGILPSFSATIDALNNKKFDFSTYITMIHKDLNNKLEENQSSYVVARL